MPLGVAGWGAVAAAGTSAVIGGVMNKGGGGGGGGDVEQMVNAGIALQQQNIANEQWGRYKSTYAPLEDAYVAEAQNRGSIANQTKAAGEAAAATTSAFAEARRRLSTAPGLDPTSQRYLQEMNRIGLAEAAASATGQNNARSNVVAQGDALRTDALNIGRGFAGQAQQGLSSAASVTANNRNFAAGQAQQSQQRADQVAGGIGKAIGGIVESKAFQNWLSKPSDTSIGADNSSGDWMTYGTGHD